MVKKFLANIFYKMEGPPMSDFTVTHFNSLFSAMQRATGLKLHCVIGLSKLGERLTFQDKIHLII